MSTLEGIIHIRIDDRLIHGQVAGLWTNELKATRLMVINDQVATDDTQKSLLRMVAPGTVNTSIITEETAFANISAGKYAGQRVFVILKSPVEILNLLDRGLPIKRINVGNMSSRDNTEVIKQGISVTTEEKAAFKELLERGIEITTIRTPSNTESFLKLSDLA
ncbi:PTS system mannose/fructose/N-acetylgalactosamine-transporter subunit IIB [Enterococcus sp. AZ072]|uniref:PTS system mannose/fructose/N-acetylgalactosamine-transporter subunit IIB n=1 Tax=unclassified Enterococcus TaxID=2608891 RepID=UPI003D2D6A39